MDKKWVILGQRFCDIKKHLQSIQFDRINRKYGKSHLFSKKILKLNGFDMDCQLAGCLDSLVCNSYSMNIHEIDGVRITNIFYNNFTPDEYKKPYDFGITKKHQKTITQDDYDFIQDWINKFKIFIEYLLTDFEKEFIFNKHHEAFYRLKKVCKKINKYIISLQNMLQLQTIDNHPLI